ncbi:MAG: 2-dehydro-3-deoxygalactonokinase [Ramlibacter sp.]
MTVKGQLAALDWGTSSLRAALLDTEGAVIEERAFARGILSVAPGEFPAVFEAACGDWLRAGTPHAIVSGMAGSRQGWMEAPYCACPAGFAEIARHFAWVERGRIGIVPGLSCEADGVPDVMRGEETQILGALDLLCTDDAMFVLPGTHSKWARVAQGRIETFSTFMTGEFYALLRGQSILARTLPETDGALDAGAFLRGVEQSLRGTGLLHNAFGVRTLSLFDRLPVEVLTSYLSGLVIGEELRAQELPAKPGPVVVIGAPTLTRRYEIALQAIGASAQCLGSEATWRGLWRIAQAAPW